MRDIKKRNIYIFLILTILLLLHGLNNYYILVKSRYCLNYDSIDYFNHAIEVSQILRSTQLSLQSFFHSIDLILDYTFKPPLFFLTAAPFLFLGIDKNIIAMSNLFYFAILLFATYGIGKRLYNFKVGILASFLVSMFPAIFTQSRVIMVDFALTAMVALTFYLFILNKFSSFRFSLLAGLVIGLGALTKQSYFIFLVPILVYFFLQKDNVKNIQKVRGFIFTILSGVLIAVIYYMHVPLPLSYYQHSFQYKTHPDPFFYFYTLFNHQLFPVFSLFFLGSLVFYIRKKKYFFPVMIFTLLLVFSIAPSKQCRFVLPIFPYVAVMISEFTLSLSKIRRTHVAILVLFSLLQYVMISYGGSLFIRYNPAKKILLDLPKFGVGEIGFFQKLDEGNWYGPAEEIIKIVNDNAKKNKIDRIKIIVIGQHWRMHSAINYLSIIQKNPIKATIEWVFFWEENKDCDFDINQSDFIVLERMPPGGMWFPTKHFFKAFNRDLAKFIFVKNVAFPDNCLSAIYMKSNQ